MNEVKLNSFVDALTRYFAQTTNIEALVDAPFLSNSTQSLLLGFTGRIRISGSHRGDVIFTAPHRMLTALLAHYGHRQTDKDHLLDLVGEIANTVTGNARELLGADFEVSTPDSVRGSEIELYHQKGLKSYCIPLKWNELKAMLIVSATPIRSKTTRKSEISDQNSGPSA